MEQVEHYGLGICSVFDGTITVDKLEVVFPSKKIQGDKRTVREDGKNEKNNRAVALLVLYSGKQVAFMTAIKQKFSSGDKEYRDRLENIRELKSPSDRTGEKIMN